jgi:phosphoribosylpyrophosphate synthetase
MSDIKLAPIHYLRDKAPADMSAASQLFEHKYNVEFKHLIYFSKDLLKKLHHPGDKPEDLQDHTIIGSLSDQSILSDINILSDIANRVTLSRNYRQLYFEALKSIYGKLPRSIEIKRIESEALFVGIEREGRILAEAMRWMPPGRSLHPNAKRIPYESGLLVGLTEISLQDNYHSCIVVDGAIASGATIIATIERLRQIVSEEFLIYSIHGTFEGIRAIKRYGDSVAVSIRVVVGHATPGLNKKFYAIDPENQNKLVVGDLGDTINDVAPPQ